LKIRKIGKGSARVGTVWHALCRSSVLPSVRGSASPADPASFAAVLQRNSRAWESLLCIFLLSRVGKPLASSPPILPRSSALQRRIAWTGAHMPVCDRRIHHLTLRVQSHSGLALPCTTRFSLLHAASCHPLQGSCDAIMLSATLTSKSAECGHHAACGDAIILGFIECISSLALERGNDFQQYPF